jgi:nucleotide-binding universal stress UspA family protein
LTALNPRPEGIVQAKRVAIRHLFLHLPTFPLRTLDRTIDRMCAIARRSGARVSATIVTVERPRPNALLGRYLALEEVIETQNRISIENTRLVRAALAERAAALGVACDAEVVTAAPDEVPAIVGERLRASDLGITPFVGAPDGQPHLLEALIFESGRPLLVLPREAPSSPAFDEIVIGWDHGRAAARAIGDAMPMLREARRVRVVTVDEESKPEIRRGIERLDRHLAAHGIHAAFEAIESGWHPVGERLMGHARASGADLLVLGAFGHGRARDFVLGSATRSVLADPSLPVLLSH